MISCPILSIRHIDDLSLHRTCHLSPNSCAIFRRMDYSRNTNPVPPSAQQLGGRRRRRRRRRQQWPRSRKLGPRRQPPRAPGVLAVVLRSIAGRGEDVQFRGRGAPGGPEAQHLREVGVSGSCPHLSLSLSCPALYVLIPSGARPTPAPSAGSRPTRPPTSLSLAPV